MREPALSYVFCIDNSGYPSSLETRKIYRRIPDAKAEEDGFLRVVDESGEDYLFPGRFFVQIAVPEAVEKVFAQAS
jgi:hypothetical protein